MIRLLLPLAGSAAFFLLSAATVRLLRPKQPRFYFLVYAILLLTLSAFIYVELWPLNTTEDGLGLTAGLLVQALLCFTMWNSFYSLLWGFSGGLMYDLYNEPSARRVDVLIRTYDGGGSLDRILARRLPNLVAGGYITFQDGVLQLCHKGRLVAIGTWWSFKIFSLGMGGGCK